MKLSYLVVIAAPLILGTVVGCQKQDTKQNTERRMNEYMENGRNEIKNRIENGQQEQQDLMKGNQQNANPYIRQYQQAPMQQQQRPYR